MTRKVATPGVAKTPITSEGENILIELEAAS
jgi:hypothetical protein